MSRKMPFVALILAGIATLATFNYYSLFWGIQFTFGMSVALATLFLKRGPWGFMIAIPVAISTYSLWGQPYAGITLMAEILTISLIRNSSIGDKSLRKGTILIYDFLFWLCIGAPFYYLAFTYISNAPRDTTLLLAQKSIINGSANALIAYVIYAAITVLTNKRSEKNQSVSIQALALATIYSASVFVSLFMTDKLYGNVITLKAQSMFKEIKSASYYIFSDISSKEADQLPRLSYFAPELKDADLFYKKKNDEKEILLTQNLQHLDLSENYELGTSNLRISRLLNKIAKENGANINLYVPKQDKEHARIKRYAGSLWEVELQGNDESIRIIKPAKRYFSGSLRFFKIAFPIVISTIVAGFILSIIIAYSFEREIQTVLGKAKKRKVKTSEAKTYPSLEPSPITEIKNFAGEINRRTNEIELAKQKIEELNKIAQQQLSTAGEIQQAFLGNSSDVGKQPDISLFMRPALNAGGDWYDAFDLDNKTFVIVADVCDKGIGAALFMSVFRSLIRYSAENWCTEPSDNEPLDEVISSVNNYMSTEHEDMTMFATVFIGCISHPAQRLDYVLAGHEEPILLDSKGRQQKIEVTGPAIGLFPKAEYKIKSLSFDQGSILVGFSDGVVDARDPAGKSYGHKRLLELVKTMQNEVASAKSLKDRIVDDLESHMKGTEQFDDITIATVLL